MNTTTNKNEAIYETPERLKHPVCEICESNIRTVSDKPTHTGYKCYECGHVVCRYCTVNVEIELSEMAEEGNEQMFYEHMEQGETFFRAYCLKCHTELFGEKH